MKAEFNNISISKIGTAVPENSLDLMSLTNLGTERELKTIIKTTGISSVRVAKDNMTSSDLCIDAATNILGDSENKEVDALIFVSQTRDYHLPQTSFIIQNRMNLRKDIFCLDIPLGCSGYINGLFQASLLLQIPKIKKVLLLAGDTSTKMINSKDRATRMVFGDGGSATVLEKGNDTINFNIQSDGSGADSLIIKSGAFRYPSNEKSKIPLLMEEGNYRSSEDIYMGGVDIFNFALREVPTIVDEHLRDLNKTKDNIDLLVLHQANKFMVNYLRKIIKINKEKVPIEVDNYGNTGPCSIPLVLSIKGNNYKKENKLKSVMMCGFGVGLSWGTAMTNLENTIFYKPVEI
ncbi:ketoacyl-ACP synthase III [Flavobacteriaceae bacterium]|nr:ketoacyl-ACP synthase III [Flavobacteriaceae bacterium]